MKKSIVLGIVIGCIVGAVLAGGNPTISESVEKGKKVACGRMKRLQSMFK